MKKIVQIIVAFAWAITAKAQVVLIQEDFTNNQLPPGWYEDSAGSVPFYGWWFNTGSFSYLGNGFDNHFPTIGGYGTVTQDISLVTDSFNPSGLTSVYLSYAEMYRGTYPNGVGYVEITTNNGLTWNEVEKLTNIRGNFFTQESARNVINLSSYVTGQSNVRVRFRYFKIGAGGEWSIDHVRISDFEPCNVPPDSGYAATQNKFACTGSPINLWLENLSRGAGQTYQWQYKNSSTGNTFTNIAGATNDSVANFIHNDSTIYQCLITCGTQTASSVPLALGDRPTLTHYALASGHFASICPGTYDSLYSIAIDTIPDTGYQWVWSPTYNGVYTDIAGATNSYYLLTDTNTQQWFYKCKQTCTSNNKSKLSSNYIRSFLNPHPYCYCIPYNSNICNDPQYFNGSITNVTVTGTSLNNTTGCDSGLTAATVYSYYPPLGNTTCTLTKGNTYNFGVTIDSLSTPSSIDVWIDYDQNRMFDAYENTKIAYGAFSGSTTNKNVTIPAWAVNGLTGMRVRIQQYFFNADSTQACTFMQGGETEDYMITIDSTVSIIDLVENENGLIVYPNPSKDLLTIESKNATSSTGCIYTLSDVTGRVLMQDVYNGKTTISTVSLAPAIYFITLKDKERMVQRKFNKL